MTLAVDYSIPWNNTNPDDFTAANNKIIFEYAYYADPCVYGDYPQEMKDLITGGRLPEFTQE